MSLPEKKKFLTPAPGMQSSRDHTEKVPMHLDDFEAHLAWVTAKRFHDLVPGKTFGINPNITRTSDDAKTHMLNSLFTVLFKKTDEKFWRASPLFLMSWR